MVALKNAFIQGLLAVTVAAIPLAPEESSLDVRSQETYPDFTSSALVARKNPDKCEIHIHVDSSNGLCGSHCTEKYTIDIWDKPGTQICKKWGGHETGTWYATNPGNKLELPTTKGKTFWVDGRIPGGDHPRQLAQLLHPLVRHPEVELGQLRQLQVQVGAGQQRIPP
ncbi:uncharacterized protein PG998_014850 [Apiospora kogelbergensis]|uniref:uncharacterized protein n=1 Tax=Apiospora kogelbergensis TaxID=1337665 RepID=UPI0031303F08